MKTADTFSKLCQIHGLTLKKMCELAGVNYGTLHSQIRNNRPIPFHSIDRIAQYCNISTDYFSDRYTALSVIADTNDNPYDSSPQCSSTSMRLTSTQMTESGIHITTDHVLDWLGREDSILRNHRSLIEHVDLFYPVPNIRAPLVPARIGEKSLAKVFFSLKNIADFSKKLDQLPQTTKHALLIEHIDVQQKSSYKVDDIEISVTIEGSYIAGRYRRILAPVRSETGEPFTLVYAQLIQAFAPPPDIQNENAC